MLIAAILAATLVGAAAPFSPEYVGLTSLTALVIAVMLLLAAVLLGLPKQGSGALAQVVSVFHRMGQANGAVALLALTVFAVILVMKKWAPNLPGALIAVVVAVLVSWLLDSQSHGIDVVGAVPSGIRKPSWRIGI